jgi:hypothetical protein
MKIKYVIKKKYPLGKTPRKLIRKIKYATAKEREQYENEIRSVRSIFDGII